MAWTESSVDVGKFIQVEDRSAKIDRGQSARALTRLPVVLEMTIQELGTIMQFGAAVIILILNNQFLGMVRQWQELFNDKRYSFVDIQSPDFVQVAKGYHIAGSKVSKREELKTALATMLDHKESYLLEVMVSKENNVFPMVPQGCSVSEIRLQ